jgi:insertion element IS1 protein InsB
MEYIVSDYWKPYESIIFKEKHLQMKAETFTIEGTNNLFRHFLVRMRRKAKCYSKKNRDAEIIYTFTHAPS